MRTSPSFEPTREGEARVVWGGASAYPQGTTRLTQLPEGVCVPAPPVRSQATRFQRLHAPAGRPAPSTGSRSAPPQPKAPCWPEAGFPDPEKAPWSSCRLGSHCPAVGSPTTQTVSALSVQAWNGSGTEEPPSHRPRLGMRWPHRESENWCVGQEAPEYSKLLEVSGSTGRRRLLFELHPGG